MMDSQEYEEIKEEIVYLENKKSQYGWTKKDVERYEYLIKYMEVK